MTTNTVTTSLSALVLAGVAVGGLAGAASAQTREHVLLARQVGYVADAPDDGGTALVVLRWEKLRVP